jgi:hypothetical protein
LGPVIEMPDDFIFATKEAREVSRRHDLTLFRRMADRATILPLDALARMTAMTNTQRTLRTGGGQRA